MDDFQFRTELDDENRIPVPPEVVRSLPAHASVTVHVHINRPQGRKSNGALKYYMERGIDMPGVLPFDRASLYRFS